MSRRSPGPGRASAGLTYRSVVLIAPHSTPELVFEHGIAFADGLPIA